MGLSRKIKHLCLLLPVFSFFCFYSTVSAEETTEVYTDPSNGLSVSYKIDLDVTPYVVIQKSETCTVNSDHSVSYYILMSSTPFTVDSRLIYNDNYTRVNTSWSNYNSDEITSCSDYSNLIYSSDPYFFNQSSAVFYHNTTTPIIYNNFDIKNESGDIVFPENSSGSGGVEPPPEPTPDPDNPTEEDIFETLKSWLVPTEEEVKGLFDLIQTDFENKFPIINEISEAFNFVETTPDEILQMGSAEGFSSMLEFEFAGHKFDFLSGIVTNNDITSFIRDFVGMIFFVITLWIFIHELPEIVKG